MYYVSAVDDPWFAAHRQFSAGAHDDNTEGTWIPDAFIQVLACADQYQICNPSTNRCSPLDNFLFTVENPQQMGLNEYQNETAFIIMNIGTPLFMTCNLIGTPGADTLLATRQMLPTGLSASIPDNQWTLEVA